MRSFFFFLNGHSFLRSFLPFFFSTNKADTIYKKFDKSDKSDSAKKGKLKRNCNHGILETIKVAAITRNRVPPREEQMEINKQKKKKRKKGKSRHDMLMRPVAFLVFAATFLRTL